LIQASWRRLRF